MKIYNYCRVYSYGDCEEEYFIKAENEEEALSKVSQLKLKNGDVDQYVDKKHLTEVDFGDKDIIEWR